MSAGLRVIRLARSQYWISSVCSTGHQLSMAASLRPKVTVFSNVNGIQSMLHKCHPDIPLQVVKTCDCAENGARGLARKLSQEDYRVLAEAEILLTEPTTMVGMLHQFPKLKWMQCTWAGVDGILNQLDRTKPLPDFTLTRFGGRFGVHMREYVIGHIIAHERCFSKSAEDQKKSLWTEVESRRPLYRTLPNLSMGILGVGDIGKEIAMACKTLGMTVWGLVRQDLPASQRSPHVDQYRRMEQCTELLENCDYVCNVLPSTKDTVGLLNGNMLQNCQKKKSVFINVGRGDVISEDHLVNALEQGWISGAILDVFEPEPLLKESPLWNMKQVTITPHIAAQTFADEIMELFAENYERYVNGEDLKHVVSWERGY